jgi:hypothetical protein
MQQMSTKMQLQIEWRRAKVMELLSKGENNQSEIARKHNGGDDGIASFQIQQHYKDKMSGTRLSKYDCHSSN